MPAISCAAIVPNAAMARLLSNGVSAATVPAIGSRNALEPALDEVAAWQQGRPWGRRV